MLKKIAINTKDEIDFKLMQIQSLQLKNGVDYTPYSFLKKIDLKEFKKIQYYRSKMGDKKFLEVLKESLRLSNNSYQAPVQRFMRYLEIKLNHDTGKQNQNTTERSAL